jgi:hypothetical protein
MPRDLTWLVVLEVPWHTISADRDYSFGTMLREFFSRQPGVRVRQRFFTNEAALRRHLRELTLIPEPVVVVVATHGLPHGIPLDGGTADAKAFGETLRYGWDLRLLHFSACLLMQDPEVVAKWQELASRLGFAVSGYATSVDWAASAIIEFAYLELILARGLTPAEAAEQVGRLLPFAGDAEVADGVFPAAGFRIVCRREFRPRTPRGALPSSDPSGGGTRRLVVGFPGAEACCGLQMQVKWSIQGGGAARTPPAPR